MNRTKEKLLRVAENILESQGLEYLTMRALGEAAGVSRSAAYKHYSNKTEILCAIATRGFISLRDEFQRIFNEIQDTTKRIEGFFTSYFRFAMANPSCYRLMYGKIIMEQDRTIELTESASEAYKIALEIIIQGQKNNEIRSDNPRSLTNAAWAMLHGFTISVLDKQLQSPGDFPALMEQETSLKIENPISYYVDILLNGILRNTTS